jgi:hypothetical protein
VNNIRVERQWRKVKTIMGELHIPILEAWVELEAFDQAGKRVQRRRERAHTWVRNAYNTLFTQLSGKGATSTTFGAGELSIKQTSGTVYGVVGNPFGVPTTYSIDTVTAYGYRAAAGDDTYGIWVGGGTAAESFEDYILATKIANGSGAGQLSYVQGEANALSYNAGTKVLQNQVIRYFNNNSGAGVDVNEVGIVICGQNSTSNPIKWLMDRTKLGATVTVPNTGQLKVTYSFQLTYPA